jgi:D-alanyl-D-alanine carboxypeptidase-like protein
LGVLVSLRRFSRCRAATGGSLAIASSLIVVIMMGGQAAAETPSPAPEPTMSAPNDAATASTSATPSADNTAHVAAAAAGSLSLSIKSTGGPVAGHFFQDIGSYAFTGAAADLDDGTAIEIYRRTAASGWTLQASTQLTAESYSATLPVRERGTFTFVSTTGGAPGSGDEISSNEVVITVEDSKITLDQPVAQIDSLKDATIRGTIVPARGGVEVHVDVKRSDTYQTAEITTTDSSGRFSTSLSYGKGSLATYRIRGTYKAPNRDRWEVSSSETFTRIAVINAVITQTTAAEVEKTYHAGCPVGPSELRTVTMNFYGLDKKMHRGLLIVRSDLTTEVIRSFNTSLEHRFRVAKMKNPDIYDGNDPRQMEANNTSAFNCRQVVGNPYKLSPHSYGTSIDVNPVQNPYRDINGKWWPDNGKPYIDRTPLRSGMLNKESYLTQKLRAYDFFWGGLWSPGKDYQHFEYRG